jgi:pimeloyl-ACP methyl ester carboxylesterase
VGRAALTQRESNAVSSNEGVILLHGISRTQHSMHRMESALAAHGLTVLNLGYASRHKSLQELAHDIHADIAAFIAAVTGPVHIVAHSMGGLLAQVYLARHPHPRIGRIVMLGTPNKGSEIADLLRDHPWYRRWFGPAGQQLVTQRDRATSNLFSPLSHPVGVIAGNRSLDPFAWVYLPKPNDGRVSVANTRMEGMADHIVVDTAHAFLPVDPEAIEQTIAFLRDGKFRR